jgi:hypothetical protein
MSLSIVPLSIVPLPLTALKLISEYSKPVTRPDWRTFERKMNTTSFISQIVLEYKIKVFKLVSKNMRESDFVIAYYYIYTYGINMYIMTFGGEENIILSNKILNDRNEKYKNYGSVHYKRFYSENVYK